MLTWIAVAIGGTFILAVWLGVDNWSRDFTTNFAELDSENADVHLRPRLLEASPESVAESISRWASRHSGWAVESKTQLDASIRLHLTRTTPLFRFVDDIHVTLVGIDGKTRLDAESRSRVGIGDLGQNPRNLKELLAGLEVMQLDEIQYDQRESKT
ncbi:DUF1499 domain-containing protein [Novipirellula artificiosorum]|uniref:DUF1499 domain-containing protein n=1 Tax=Novipirellula artificiosorum TaxID=2528016 RepID=A0A5C6DCH1_9BACT|nr:DUF1499 domain-containing protein [Novipirellula artificiosorum]TWU33411.1 hypothetical protein Poly41_51650 [Novipirellula artificiosorum]